jgi:drug/metabolite transporter (DMT)-like permease
VNLALLLATGSLIATLYALGKAAVAAGATPAVILLWQVGGGALGLSLLAGRAAAPPLTPAHLRYYALSGTFGVAAPGALVYFALQSVEVGLVTLLTALSALFTYAGALLGGLERFSPLRLAGCGLGLLGLALLAAPAPGAPPALPLAAALAAPMFLAAGNLYRTLAWPAGATPLALAAGMLWTLLPPVAAAVAIGPAAMPQAAWPWLAALAALAPLSYSAHFALQRRGGPVYLSQLGYVMAVAGAALGYLFFDERPGWRLAAAAALIAAGLLAVNRRASGPGHPQGRPGPDRAAPTPQAVATRGAGARPIARDSAKAPSPSSTWAPASTVRYSGYSQPPSALLNTQPLPACAQVAPTSTGTSAAAAMRVPMPSTSAAPPIASSQKTT